MRPDTQQWWDQAEADLRSARVLMSAGLFYAVSFFSQQAAEKILKALFVERQSRLPPRTHDLEYLANQLGALATLKAELSRLAPVFDMARYPDSSGAVPVHAIRQPDAQAHLNAAERIFQWISSQL